MTAALSRQDALRVLLLNPWERLNRLYRIVTKEGVEVPFRCNDIQREMWGMHWFRNVICKPRRPGSTTLWTLVGLDRALFKPNQRVVIIAHEAESARQIFRDMVLYPYDHLPPEIRARRKTLVRRKGEVVFSNNSSVRVTMSARSGSCDMLIVTEFGKMSAKKPLMAAEVIAGTLPAVHENGVVVVESTAEGRSGEYFRLCDTAKKLKQSGRSLTKLDFRLQFFPWFADPKNVLTGPAAEEIVITKEFSDYFEKLKADLGVETSMAQRRWYVTMHERLGGEKMHAEFPSSLDEAFEVAVLGAYYSKQLAAARIEKRITKVPHDPSLPVDTAWDLGVGETDQMEIIFFQRAGRQVRVIDHYECTGEGLPHCVNVLAEKQRELGYAYGEHFGPHDIASKEVGTGRTRIETAAQLGLHFKVVPRTNSVMDDIEECRKMLKFCAFDEARCALLLRALENYRRDWDEERATFRSSPVHDWSSHPADGFRTMVKALRRNSSSQILAPAPAPVSVRPAGQKLSSGLRFETPGMKGTR